MHVHFLKNATVYMPRDVWYYLFCLMCVCVSVGGQHEFWEFHLFNILSYISDLFLPMYMLDDIIAGSPVYLG